MPTAWPGKKHLIRATGLSVWYAFETMNILKVSVVQ